MLRTFSFIGILLAFGTSAMQTAAVAQAPQTQAAVADPSLAQDFATGEEAAEPAIERLRAELERQRRIAENARYQVERLRTEIALKDELLELGRERNRALYSTGSEILQRYADMGLGDVVSAREPFVQKGRVELENLVQDYEDALRAARFTGDTLPPSVEQRMREELTEARSGEQPADADTATDNQAE
ncbi:hypothetical protein AM2010_285 [Pelagerythrobacter marensis]|uniref:Uncharacterized protein n=2 Tax=Pelagerythrobacter marensis TaxID=543877 RepID=A0A0G3X6Y4_9SPHN|nr:hypothetical protein AM2010_285 [Pelagerythrobacter marensis]